METKDLMKRFEQELPKYETTITELLGKKYGITAKDFMFKALTAVKKTPDLLKCTTESLFGSILYFAEIGLPFDTHEGFGYILTETEKNTTEAVPLIGYKGLIEIAYRNPKIKSIRIQSVYTKDEFDYEYGTTEFIKHKPCRTGDRGELDCVYSIAQVEGINPLFVVVHKPELEKIKKSSKSAVSKHDLFNIMEAKVALKLLFKTLPKTDNEALIRVLEMDNKFDFEKNTKIVATQTGYEIVESKEKTTALTETTVQPISVTETQAMKDKKAQGAK